MHKAYQPLKPAANKYLQKKWDQEHYDEHRKKVCSSIYTIQRANIHFWGFVKIFFRASIDKYI